MTEKHWKPVKTLVQKLALNRAARKPSSAPCVADCLKGTGFSLRQGQSQSKGGDDLQGLYLQSVLLLTQGRHPLHPLLKAKDWLRQLSLSCREKKERKKERWHFPCGCSKQFLEKMTCLDFFKKWGSPSLEPLEKRSQHRRCSSPQEITKDVKGQQVQPVVLLWAGSVGFCNSFLSLPFPNTATVC